METSASRGQRSCADCNTTKTPLWRGGPTGPKSLCNACGIRNRKKRRALVALNNKHQKCRRGRSRSKVSSISFEMRLLALERDAVLHKDLLQKSRQLEEDEEAAVLLMTLSCDLVNT